MKIKLIGYLLGIIFLVFFSSYAYKKYVFTREMPSSPDLSNNRTVEVNGFYGRRVFVTSGEAALLKNLNCAMYASGGLFFLFCAKYGKLIGWLKA